MLAWVVGMGRTILEAGGINFKIKVVKVFKHIYIKKKNIEIELNYINKLLVKLFILNTNIFIYLKNALIIENINKR